MLWWCLVTMAWGGGRLAPAEPLNVRPHPGAVAAEADGRFHWRWSIDDPGAAFLKVHFTEVDLTPGAELLFRSGSGRLLETVTGTGPRGRGAFWSLSSFDGTMEIELVSLSPDADRFRIDGVRTGEVIPGAPSVCPAPDFEDAVCYETDAEKWANVQASFVTLSDSQSDPLADGTWCSGAIIDPNGLGLTNEHCMDPGECDEIVFDFTDPGCEDGSVPADYVSYRCGDTLVEQPFVDCDAVDGELDFALIEIDGDPELTYGWVVPDPTPVTSGEDIYIVQHPDDAATQITHGGGNNVVVDGTVLRYFDTLDTDGGSSGSPIFRDSDDLMVGLHHCGGCTTPGQGNRGMLMADILPYLEPYLCTDEVVLAVEDVGAAVQVSGDDDAVVEAGETWSVSVTVRNRACSLDAADVWASVAPVAGTQAVAAADVGFGSILAATTVTADVVFDVPGDAACGRSLQLELVDLMDVGAATGVASPLLSRPIGVPGDPLALASDDLGGGLGGFTIEDAGAGTGPSQTWSDTNPSGRNVGLPAPFALVDGSAHGDTMDEGLIWGPVDVLGPVAHLSLRHELAVGPDTTATVEVRSDATGGAWELLRTWTDQSRDGGLRIDLSDQAGLATEVRLGFAGEPDGYWAVDDLLLEEGDGTCLTGPTFTTDGTCPGPVTLSARGLTPQGDAWLLSGDPGGSANLPGGACTGTTLDLDNLVLRRRATADATGAIDLSFNPGAGACGVGLQWVDAATCQTTEALAIP